MSKQDQASSSQPFPLFERLQGSLPAALAVMLLLCAFTVFTYSSLAGSGFINFDDPYYVSENPHVLQGLTMDGVRWAFSNHDVGHWLPVSWLSHMLDVSLFGPNPGAHHLVNLCLHLLNILLLFWVLHRLTGTLWPGVAVATLFALHPLNVESVAWIAERKNVLSTLFFLLTLLAYAGYAKRPGILRYCAVFLAMALGMMAKPMLVTLPFVLLLLDYWPLKRTKFLRPPSKKPRHRKAPQPGASLGALILEKIPFLVLAAVVSYVTYALAEQSGTIGGGTVLSPGFRLANAVNSYAAYLGKTFLPRDLALLYTFQRLPSWQVGLAGGLLALITAFALWKARKAPYVLVGWLWFLGTLVPAIGLVQAGNQAMADRHVYVPLLGIFIALVWGINDLLQGRKYKEPLLAGIFLCLALTLGHFAHAQALLWKDSRPLYAHTVAVTKDNYTMHFNLASAYAEHGQYGPALEQYGHVLEIRPRYVQALNNKAWLLATVEDPELRDPEQAVTLARNACNITGYKNPYLLDTLAEAYASAGRLGEARDTINKALAIARHTGPPELIQAIEEHKAKF